MNDESRLGKTILVVDDDALTREAVGIMLASAGYAVASAPDGGAALASLRRGLAPDLIVLDLLMPGIDGWHFRREQRRDPALAAIPIVVCSGTGDADIHATALGAVGFINKPLEADQFLQTVTRVLGRAQA